jgi:hypothetical protein
VVFSVFSSQSENDADHEHDLQENRRGRPPLATNLQGILFVCGSCLFTQLSLIGNRVSRRPGAQITFCQSLLLLEHLVKNGSENLVEHAKSRVYDLRTLKQYAMIDEKGKDQGINGKTDIIGQTLFGPRRLHSRDDESSNSTEAQETIFYGVPTLEILIMYCRLSAMISET